MLTFRNAFWCKLPLMYSGDFRPNRHRWISRLFCSYSHHSPRIVLLFRRINASQLKNDTKNINHSFILIPYTSYKQILLNSNGLKIVYEGRKEDFFLIHLRIFMINLYYMFKHFFLRYTCWAQGWNLFGDSRKHTCAYVKHFNFNPLWLHRMYVNILEIFIS